MTGQGGRNFRVRLADPASVPAALAALAAHDGVSLPAEADGGVTFLLTGDDGAAAAVLADLVGAGLSVIEFREVTTGLEELFMQVTKGVVQ